MAYTPNYERNNYVNGQAPAINAGNLNSIESAIVSLETNAQTDSARIDTMVTEMNNVASKSEVRSLEEKLGAEFIVSSNNLFDKDSSENLNGYWYNNVFYPSDTYKMSHYIKLDGSVTSSYAFKMSGTNLILELYDADKNLLLDYTTGATNVVSITSEYKYMRFAYYATDTEVMCVKGSVVPTTYEPYSESGVSTLKVIDDIQNDIKNITYGTAWYGQRAINLGDSIVWYDGRTNSLGEKVIGYSSYLKDLGFAECKNLGVSGQSVAVSSSGANALVNYVDTVDFSNCQLVTIADGVNDWQYNVAISDFKTAYNSAITKIKAKTTAPIVIFTPLQCATENTQNTLGLTLVKYADAVKEIAVANNVSCVDMYTNGGIDTTNTSTYTIDGLHPNNKGYKLISNVFKAAIAKERPTSAIESALEGYSTVSGSSGGGVTSVNGYTGAVQLTYEDVGALSSTTKVPTIIVVQDSSGNPATLSITNV